jgi:type I restriction enzyme R subunit
VKKGVDDRVYDQNDILKKDRYFAQTVMLLINDCIDNYPNITPTTDDYKFINERVSKQYINQYNATYGN